MSESARRRVSAEQGHRVFAWLYARAGRVTEHGPLGEHRARLVAQARGVTVDLGAGVGGNVAHVPAAVGELHLVEPDPHMRRRLERAAPPGAVVHAVGGEQLPFPDASVDTVLSTLTLCSVDDPAAVAAELHRVLRPDGQLLVLEHVRSDDLRTARRQRRFTPVQRRFAGGCHLDRDTVRTLVDAGFDAEGVEVADVPAPAVTRRLAVGRLTPFPRSTS